MQKTERMVARCDTHVVTDFNGVDSGDILCEKAVFGKDLHDDALCAVDSGSAQTALSFFGGGESGQFHECFLRNPA